MVNISLEEVLNAVDGVLKVKGLTKEFKRVSIDSRKIEKGSIFFALRGNNFNGNEYVSDASDKGAHLCIVDEIHFREEQLTKYTSVIMVEDCRAALLSLARYCRNKLSLKVIGITGSTGKTSTKDLVAAMLGGKFKVFKTKGNFNNEIGLPLMIFELDESYDVAVLEMGMSNFGEIHRLAEVGKPDIAIITNIGLSHIEHLKSRENILKAKLEITDFFEARHQLIVNADNDLLKTIKNRKFKVVQTGLEEEYDFYGRNIELDEESVKFEVMEKESGAAAVFKLPIPGKHNILNALLAISCGKALGMTFEEMKAGIHALEFTSMRLDIIRGDRFTIIDDSYNASPDSMKAAIDVLLNMGSGRKIAVLGTMKELGTESYRGHYEIGQYAAEKGVDLLLTLGEYNEAFLEGFKNKEKCRSFHDRQELIEYVTEYIDKEDAILIKASRSMKFEEIVKQLKLKMC